MRIVLLSPAFHGYWRSIQHGLEQCGHDVTTVVYDERAAMADKLLGKLTSDVPRHLGRDRFAAEARRATARADEQLRSGTPDMLVVVRGDAIDPALVDSVRMRGARTVLWLYDELRRTRFESGQLECYDLVATYSPADAADLRRILSAVIDLPLAFDERLVGNPGTAPMSPELLFIGARYPNRERILFDAAGAGVDVQAFGRDWSRHPVDRIRSLSWRRPAVPDGRDLDRSAAARATAHALTTLNIHGDQDGFTMRTFEVCGVGGLQLVDRPDVALHYEPGTEVVVVESTSEIVEAVGRAHRDTGWARRIRESGQRRTLAHHTFRHRCEKLLSSC